MYRKILVALDNSAVSNLLFQRALDLAQAMAAQLLIVHGLSSEEEGSPLPIPPAADDIFWASGTETNLKLWRESWQRYETASLDRLQQFAAIANAADVETEFRQV
ncbi:MAG: universal stress protein, partial [Leptolyngbyaceae cyanobacterium SM2_3_12]|nr:universal stress protein [Leptolyngbyaceae cyanobacterium SM2_3_12]